MKSASSTAFSLDTVHATITSPQRTVPALSGFTDRRLDKLDTSRAETRKTALGSFVTGVIPQSSDQPLTAASIPNSATGPPHDISSGHSTECTSLLRRISNLKQQQAVGACLRSTGTSQDTLDLSTGTSLGLGTFSIPSHKSPPSARATHYSSSPSTLPSSSPSTPHSSITDSIDMSSSASPIDIATSSRTTSSSPSSQGTRLGTYQIPDNQDSRTSAMMSGGGFEPRMSLSRKDSYAGAKPIQMNNPNRGQDSRTRRESFANGSFIQNSFGGVSVGSWIREDIMMTGTSPYPLQSPSYHSSSYLPKLEANFMRDFSCCGKTLPSLHDLLTHYEECHAQQTPQSLRSASMAQQARDSQQPNGRPALAMQSASAIQQQQRQQSYQQAGRVQNGLGMGNPTTSGSSALSNGIQQMRQAQSSQPTTPVQARSTPEMVSEDMEGVENMDMDDPIDAMEGIPTPTNNIQVNGVTGFGQRPAMNLTNTNGMVHQGLRTSQPTTPAASGFGFQHNPTVSSVNTPTLSAAMHGNFSPDTSVPGTPAELDDDYASMLSMNNMNNLSMGNMNVNLSNMNNLGNMNLFGIGNDLGLDLCIDEPAKRLYSPNGGFGTQQHRQIQQQLASFNLNAGNQFGGMNLAGMSQLSNEDIMRRIQQQKFLAQMQGLGGMSGQPTNIMAMGDLEHKPFKCPVIGCEKAYKNQNGLKYHKTHGHMTQQLHENGDGTFSIVNPETSTPYPGTMGMEKEKPYKCEVCGKRYKNLNGLKYHKQHSLPCNPELKLNGQLPQAGMSSGLAGLTGTGLPGIGE